jgi:hypothetical protein
MTIGNLLEKPQHVVSLATSCVLVHPEVNVWTATRQDNEISEEVTTAKKADRDSGKFVKHLLAKNPEHRRVLNYRQTVYNWMQRRTYDWAGSQRILPAVQLTQFMREFNEHEQTFKGLVDDFIKAYPTIVSNMAFVQGDMFKREDYPSVNEVFSKFSIRLYTAEVPVGDFRCQIAQDLAADLQTHYERQARDLVENIINRQKEQLVEVMRSISHCCETETVVENGEIKIKRRKLYDTTLQRAIELCDTFAKFNVTEDPQLDEVRTRLKKALDGVTIDALRNHDTTRIVVKEEVDDILAKFGV